jgi:hypothetical protein
MRKTLWIALVAGAASPLGAGAAEVEVDITSIALQHSPRGDEGQAIDNNFGSFSYLTSSGASGIDYAYLGLASPADIGKFRWTKALSDVDGVSSNNPDHSELQILYTTDTGPLASRTYLPVTGLRADASEQPVGTIDPVLGMIHAETGPGGAAYSVLFDPVSGITALAFRFGPTEPPPDDGLRNWTHYPVTEFQAFVVPEPANVALLGLGGLLLARRRRP